MSGDVCVQPSELRSLSGRLQGVVDELKAAQQAILDSAGTGDDSFSPAGGILAWTFGGAIEFAGNDAFEQAEQIASIQARLHTSADKWEAAEDASTVTTEC